MHKSKIKQISLAVCLAFMPLSGFAAGLGKLNVNSGLGEPLKAEVELLSVTPEELSTLVATIASEEAYAVQGITRLGVHGNIKVDLAKNADGSPVLRLRSSQPISDPYLDMLIQVDWASGRLLREYTVLLDPPGYKETINQTPSNNISLPSTASRSNNSGLVDRTDNAAGTVPQAVKKSKKFKKVADQTADKEAATADAGQLMTVRGDTLNSIAKEMQIEGVSLDQMLVGLYENNKEAFSNGNMNRLKIGQIIKAPSKDVFTAIDAQQARQAIKVHSANWNDYRNSLAGGVAETPAVAESEQKQSASGKIATAEDKAAPVKAGTQDVVKLSGGSKEVVAGSKEGNKDFDAKILALQEDATAREKALKESLDRTAALEKQIEDMQKLLALKNQTMTDLQKNAAAQPADANAVAPTEAKPVDAPPVKPVKKAPAVVTAPVTPEPEPSFIESLFGDMDMTLVGGTAGLGLLGAGWLYLRNKRRKDLDSFERGILTSGGLRANTVFGNTTGNASTSDTSFLTDFAQSADGSMIDTNDVDPIAEAEVYMAYGRDAQAEEILKDAISKEPKRYELHLKLLEMYAGRKDTSAFETIAGELYTTLGTDDPVWAKVVELGATVEPGNPLYDASKSTGMTSSSTEKLDASDFADAPVATDAGLDFSLDDALDAEPEAEDAGSAVMQSFAAAENVEQDLSFDLGTVDDDSAEVASLSDDDSTAVNPDENTSSESDAGLEFNVGELTKSDDAALQEAVVGNADNTDNAMDFDLSDDLSPQQAPTVDASASLPVIDFAGSVNSAADEAATLDFAVAASPVISESQSADATDFGLEFDLPSVQAEPVSAPEITLTALDDISFDLDSPVEAAQSVEKVEEISFDLPSVNDEPSLSLGSEDETETDSVGANEFDFSAISLDLGDATEQMPEDMTVEMSAPTASENQDVDIKLDLVAAYIDMDDKEGARELLDEVIKEGGPQQRQRAEQLLASLA